MTQTSAGAMQDTIKVERGTRGRFKPGQSGNPSGRTLSKRFTELFDAMAADVGGAAALSAIDRVLLMQVAGLLVRSERAKDADICVRCANAASRLLASLRNTKRQGKPAPVPTLASYLASKAAPADDDEAA